MAEKKETEKEKPKYRPVHEVVKEFLETAHLNVYSISMLAILYTRGAIVPKNEIPGLIIAFEKAKKRFFGKKERVYFEIYVDKVVSEVIVVLKEQLAEAEKKEEEEKRRIKEE